MSVAPDLLLKSAPEVKTRAAAAKAPAKPAESSRNQASSFSQEYAKARVFYGHFYNVIGCLFTHVFSVNHLFRCRL